MTDPKKIGMLVDTFLPVIGGAEIHVLELSRALRASGYELMVCTASDSNGDLEKEEFHVTRIPSLRYSGWSTWLRLPFALPTLLQFIRKVDVVHCHYTFFIAMLGTALGRMLGKRTVVTLHGLGTLDSSVGKSVMMRFCRWTSLKLADVIIATSQEMRSVAIRFVPDERIEVIPNGVDTSRFLPKVKLETPDIIILTMRRLVPKNGVQFLVEAAPIVISAVPHVYFWVAGEGKLEATIRQRVTDLGLDSYFRFIGTVPHDQTVEYYHQADLVVFPSSAESTSLACLEAMSMEKAIVASNLEAYQDMLGTQERGLTVNLYNRVESDYNTPLSLPDERIEALAAAIIKLAKDPVLRQDFGRKARSFTVENYDWIKIAGLTSQQYLL